MNEEIIISEEFINLKSIIRSKNPTLLKVLPSFVFNYLNKIIHVKELNAAIYRNRDKFGLDFADAILEEFGADIHVINYENLPKTGRYIVASNHPLGGLDGMALMSVVGKVRKDIVFPVNDLLMHLPNLKQLFIPINKHGSNADNINTFEETFASDLTMLFFPAGLCSRKQSELIMDSEWKKSFLTKAKQHKRDIIPTFIDGKNSDFFYNLSNFRKSLGIKGNIEMLYLVDEMYKQKNKKINIIFGKPISYQTFDKTLKDKEWAEKLRTYVYQLKHKTDLVFNT